MRHSPQDFASLMADFPQNRRKNGALLCSGNGNGHLYPNRSPLEISDCVAGRHLYATRILFTDFGYECLPEFFLILYEFEDVFSQ